MNALQFFLSSLIAYSGIIVGILLIRLAKEEQKPLQNYFETAQKIILILISSFLLFFLYFFSKILFLISLFLGLLSFLKNKKNKILHYSILHYAILGTFFYLSSRNQNLFAINSSFLFIYGVIYSGLHYRVKGKNAVKLLLGSIVFLILSNLLFTIFHF